MKIRVTLDGRITSTSGALDDSVRDPLRVTLEELNKLGARNAAIDLDRGTGAIAISCCVDVEDLFNAVPPASDNIRLALHTGEIGTPNWPSPTDSRWRVEFVRSRSEAVPV